MCSSIELWRVSSACVHAANVAFPLPDQLPEFLALEVIVNWAIKIELWHISAKHPSFQDSIGVNASLA